MAQELSRLKIIFSDIALSLYVKMKCIINIIKLPWYLTMNYSHIKYKWKALVANLINLEKDYQKKIQMLDYASLQKLLNGNPLEIKSLYTS